MSKELVLEAIYRAYRIVNDHYGKDYVPCYDKPRSQVDVLAALELILKDVKANSRLVSIDLETMFCTEFGSKALDPWHPDFKVWCIGISLVDYKSVCVPFDPDPYLIEKFGLTSIQESPRILEIFKELAQMNCLAHSTMEALALSRYGLYFTDYDDLLLLPYAIDDQAGDLGVDDLAKFHTEEQGFKNKDYPKAVSIQEMEWDKLANRCCYDADIERRLFYILKEKAIKEDVWRAYQILKEENMIGIQETLNGVDMNVSHLVSIIKVEEDKKKPFLEKLNASAELRKTFELIQHIAATNPKYKKKYQTIKTLSDVKISKSWVLEVLLFDVCKFPSSKKTGHGARSTEADELEKAKAAKPSLAHIIDWVLEIKKVDKKLSTYLLPYIEPKVTNSDDLSEEEIEQRLSIGKVDRFPYIKEDGYIHPRFNFHKARSSRSSSDQPNFQNVINEVLVKMSFISRVWKTTGVRGNLTMPDYDKHEVRMAAWQCQDPMMIKALEVDIHTVNQAVQAKLIKPTEIASITPARVKELKNTLYMLCLRDLKHSLPEDVYSYPYYELMKELDSFDKDLMHEWETKYQKKRTTAKESTFGPLFGQQPPGFAASQGISIKEAEEVFDIDHKLYPIKHKYANELKNQAREDGFVQSIFGMKRRLDYKACRGDGAKIAALDRQAINTKLSQGPASVLTVLAMGQVMKGFKEYEIPALGVGTIHDALAIDNADNVQEEVNTICLDRMENYPIELLGPNQVKFKAELKWGPSWGEVKKS